jgi:hypothetical protein
VDFLLWVLAVVLFGVAFSCTLPRPPALDWELYFKVVLATLLRGEVESGGGKADEWYAKGRKWIWFHPAARNLSQKITAPGEHEVPVPALEGELALVADLAALEGGAARIQRLFGTEGPDDLLYDDPAWLGEAYAPANLLGAGLDWDQVASFGEELVAALHRRCENVHWAFVGASAALEEAMGACLPSERVHRIEPDSVDALGEALESAAPGRSDRLVVVVSGVEALKATQALHARPGLRDRVLGVVGVGAKLGGEGKPWLSQSFDHVSMDTEVARATSWFHLAFLVAGEDLPGDVECPLDGTSWPCPPVPQSGRASIETVDLGVLPGPAGEYPAVLLGRAILVTVTARLTTG